MVDQDKIVKIYDLSVIGEQETLKVLDKVNNKFVEIKKNKLSLNSLKAEIEDPEELKKIDKQLADLLMQEKKLAVELKQKQVLMKEYQILAAKEREEKKKQAAGNEALAGTYNDVAKRYRELLAISKNTTLLTDPQEVAQAQAELKKYKDLLDNFNRGLTKDGTLVGEYTTGILQAFKNSGLDEVINNQLNNAKKNVHDLNQEFEDLKKELQKIQQTGQGSTNVIEKQMLENRQAAQQFQNQIERVENELRTMNSTGSSIGATIGLQFRNLKQDMAGFVLGFVGFQAALGKIQEFGSGAVEEFEQAEQAGTRLVNRLKNMGRENELAGLEGAIDGLVAKFKYLDNDDLKNATEKLVTYGKVNEEQIKTLLPIIVDFAANTGSSIQESTSVIIKGLEGSGKALKEYGIDLKDVEEGSSSYAQIVDVLGVKVRDSAQTFADSATGGLEVQRQKLRDLQEELGARLLPLLIQSTTLAAGFGSVIASIPSGALVTGVVALTAAYGAYRVQLALANKESFLWTVLSKGKVVADGLATASTWLMTKATTAARIEFTLFNTAIKISPLGWLLTILGLLIPALVGLASVYGDTAREMREYNDNQKDINDAMQEGIRNSTKEVSALDGVYKKTQDVNSAMSDRVKAANQIKATYPDAFKNFTAEQIALGKSADAYDRLRKSIIAVATEKALGSKRDALTAPLYNKLADLQLLAQAKENEKGTFKPFTGTEPIPGSTRDRTRLFTVEEQEQTRQAQVKAINKQIADMQAEIQRVLDNFQKVIDKNAADIIKPPTPTKVDYGNAADPKQGKDDKDKKINRIDDLKKEYAAAKAVLEASYEDRTLTENKFYESLIAKADEYRNTKLKAISNLSKEELEAQKEFDAQLAKEKSGALEKQFNIELDAIQKQRSLETKGINNQLNALDNQPGLSDVERIQKKIELDQKLIETQQNFNTQVDQLEAKYMLKSSENADERAQALIQIQQQLGTDLIALQEAQFAKLQEDQKQALRSIQSGITNKALGVLTDSNLTGTQKSKKLKQIEDDGKKQLAEERLKQIDIELDADKKLLEQKIISQKEYNDRVAELEQERLTLHKDINDQEVEATRKKNEDKQKLEDAAFQIASKVVDAYIQNLYAEVEANYKATQEKNKIDEDARLAQAQSDAERETIKREFEEREKQAELKRNKERQEIARKQLAIEFAIASMKALSTSTTFVDGLAKEAIAFAEYLAALSILNKQQFAFGGMVKPERLTDGLIKAAPNVAPTANGDNVLAFVKPGEVILNERQQAALGGATTFASIGVPGFGSSVQPPVFRSYTAGAANQYQNNSDDIKAMKELYYGLALLIHDEAVKPVLLNPKDVGSALAKQIKNVDLATI